MNNLKVKLQKYLPLLLIVLAICFGLYRDYMTVNTVYEHNNNSNTTEDVIDAKKHDGKCINVIEIKEDDKYLPLDTINTAIKYVDNNNNEIKFIGDIQKDEKGNQYINVEYTKDNKVVTEKKAVKNDVVKTDKEPDTCVCSTTTNSAKSNNSNNNSGNQDKQNNSSGKTTTQGNTNTNSQKPQTNTNNQGTSTKPNTQTYSNTGNSNSNNNQNNNSGSSNNQGSNNSNQQNGHWEDRQVLVKEAWTENVLVKEAYDETVQVCVKEGYYESVLVSGGETTQTCAHYDYPMIGIAVCNGCGHVFSPGDQHGADNPEHGGHHTEWIPDPNAEPVCVAWNTVTTEPVYNNIWHEPVYETQTVHHDAEYKTVYHEAEYRTERVWVND